MAQRAVALGNLLLVLVCAVLIAMVALLYTADTVGVKPVPRAKSNAVSLRWNWFRGTQPVQQVSEVGELENSTLKAELLGVMISGEISSATLAFNGKPQKVYHVGDKLGSSVTIEKIEPYRIIVKQNGKNKQILLAKADTVMETEQSTDSATGQPADGGFAMANMFGAVPVRMDGYGSGFKLNKLSKEMKMLADLENNDVVVDVGGTGVQELMSDPQQWIKYSAQSSLPVTVIRDGQPVVIYVNAASLSAKMLPKFGLNK
ncbi:MAG: type II secretion system protein N [Porticoccaceae bacterium]